MNWRLKLRDDQEFSGVAASINSSRPPATCKKVAWAPGTINVDIGGGRYDTATEYLAGIGVTNLIYDPGNRSEVDNLYTILKASDGQSDTATVNNVLNIIKEDWIQLELICLAHDALRPGGTAYFLMYEGDKSGVGRQTQPVVWQENKRIVEYLPLIRQVFLADQVITKNGLIIATKSPEGL